MNCTCCHAPLIDGDPFITRYQFWRDGRKLVEVAARGDAQAARWFWENHPGQFEGAEMRAML